MPNMSYCRFQNTTTDLRDCQDAMNDNKELSEEEARARKWLIEICVDIACDYGDEIGQPCEEV